MGNIRATYILTVFFLVTPPLMVFQWLLLRLAPRFAVRFPHVYHRNLCKRLLQTRVHVLGEPVSDGPCLIAANHCSWLDIIVFSAVKPLSFIAKREVGGWPIFGQLARLQRSIFVDRDRRSATAGFRDLMQSRLRAGDTLVRFPKAPARTKPGFELQERPHERGGDYGSRRRDRPGRRSPGATGDRGLHKAPWTAPGAP